MTALNCTELVFGNCSQQTLNYAGLEGDGDIVEPMASRAVRLCLYVMIFILTIVGNSVVIIVVYKTEELHTVTGYLIANLGAADLCVGILCIPFTLVYYELGYWPFGLVLCKVIAVVQPLSVLASIGTLAAIAADRYRALVHCFKRRFSLKLAKIFMISVWIVAATVNLPMATINTTVSDGLGRSHCAESWPSNIYRKLYVLTTFSLSYALPLPIICFMYIRIFLALKKAQEEAKTRQDFNPDYSQSRSRIVKMLAVVVVCYTLCYLLFHICILWIEFGKGIENKYIWILLNYAQLFVYANSCMNPLLYGFMSTSFRQGILSLSLCCVPTNERYITEEVPLSFLETQSRRIARRLSIR